MTNPAASGEADVGGYLLAHHMMVEYGPGAYGRPIDEIQAILLIDDVSAQYEAEQNKKTARQARARRG